MRKGHRRSPQDAQAALAGALFEKIVTIEGWNRADFAAAVGLSERHLRNARDGESMSWQGWEAVIKIASEQARTDEGRRLVEGIKQTLWPTTEAGPVVAPAAPPVVEPKAGYGLGYSLAGSLAGAIVALAVSGAILLLRSPSIPAASSSAGALNLTVDGKSKHERPQGETFQLSARGLTPGGEVVRFEEPPRYPKPGQQQSRVILRATQDGQLTWAATVGCDIAEEDYWVWLKDRTIDRETNKVVMRVVTNPKCPARGEGVDFVTTEVTLDKQRARVGEQVKVAFVIENIGTLAAPPTEARIRLGLAQVLNPNADPLLAKVNVPALEPRRSFRSEVAFAVPPSPPGAHVAWVVADALCVTLEADSMNNFGKSGLLDVDPD